MPPVLYEDAELLAVDKPAGLVTHPTYKHPDATLWDAVLARQTAQGEARPCLLHRLDRWTSGVLVFAKTERARRAVVRQFERRTVGKRYLALVVGVPEREEGEIEAPLLRDPLDRRRTIVGTDGQPALTHYRVLGQAGGHALVLATPHTGRTHQIRAHLSYHGTPLAGDARYLPEESPGLALADRAMLHAWQLEIRYPGTGDQLVITAPAPDDFIAAARRMGLENDLAALSHPS
jgi:23S rRNA pseudouridine1911/1915/1917 synthase